jgi:hypothetical protein
MDASSEVKRVNVSRSVILEVPGTDMISIGASYSHIRTLKGVIGPSTERIVIYHAFLNSLSGFEDAKKISQAYLGFNRISNFRPEDKNISKIDVLDLVGNPVKSLVNCPPCRELIVSSTLIENLIGCPEGVEIIRCGHSTHLKSLKGCPKSVIIIECSCTPNLLISTKHYPSSLAKILTDAPLEKDGYVWIDGYRKINVDTH